jgi:hypothetical protein
VITVNPSHWLNEDGSIPLDPPQLRKQALRVAQCIEYAGPLARGHARETLLTCNRKPGKKACPGFLWVLKQDDDAIHVYCVACRSDEYLIYEWEDTEWADGPMEPVDVAALARERAQAPRPATARDRDELLRRALDLVGSDLSTDQLKRLVRQSDKPTAMVQAVLATARVAPQPSALDRLMPLLMELWNETPRDELGGRAPQTMAGVPRGTNPASLSGVGRNDPCPCGSGHKYKKCCLRHGPN